MATDGQVRSGEGSISLTKETNLDGSSELFLIIENTVEDRVRAYTRLLRKRQVLNKAKP
jgi:hypothetical protein